MKEIIKGIYLKRMYDIIVVQLNAKNIKLLKKNPFYIDNDIIYIVSVPSCIALI